jgi:hypothetical protein
MQLYSQSIQKIDLSGILKHLDKDQIRNPSEEVSGFTISIIGCYSTLARCIPITRKRISPPAIRCTLR